MQQTILLILSVALIGGIIWFLIDNISSYSYVSKVLKNAGSGDSGKSEPNFSNLKHHKTV